MRRALLLLLCAPLAARAEEAVKAAAELPPVAGPLAPASAAPNALPPVTAQLFHVGGKLEVQPLLAFSLGDPFYRTFAAGVRAEQHLGERFSLGLHVLAGASSIAAPVELCGSAPCSSPAADQLRSTPGQLQLMTGVEASWTPVYGKLSLIGERTIHFDAYLSAGPELIRERIAPDAISPLASRWDAGGRASVGERVFLSDRFVVRAGLSELVYGAHVRGRVEVERKLWFEGGVAWFFGAGR